MARLLFPDINVHASSSYYAFTSPSSPSAPTLVVDRPSGNLRLNHGALLGGKRVSSIAGILGIIKLRLDKYIIIISKAQQVGRLKGNIVYKVLTTEFLSLREKPLHDEDEDSYLTLLKNFLRSGSMYFSYSLDLTNTFQRQSQADPSSPLWKLTDDRFFWNRFVQSTLIQFRNTGTRQQPGQQPGTDPYILPVIFGMLEIRSTRVKNTTLTLALITRRSRHRVGTRFFSRGIDEQGNVSNYNETEQVVILNDCAPGLGGFGGGGDLSSDKAQGCPKEFQILSFVQTRGSVPAYWAEINTLKYTPNLQIRGVETAIPAARAHFEEQVRLYGENYLINLVKHTGRERGIKDAYEKIFNLLTSRSSYNKGTESFQDEKLTNTEPIHHWQTMDQIHYIYFDFHHETKGLKWDQIQKLLDQLIDVLDAHEYFSSIDMPGDAAQVEVQNQQKGVVRTNCMDCLDRTNIVQSALARYVLNRQLTDLGILSRGESISSDVEFESLFRNVWADNADFVAMSYAGSGALKTDLTRTGSRKIAGLLQDLQNCIKRYIQNNFLDGPKQDASDLFMGNYIPNIGSTSAFVDRRPLLVQSIPYIFAFSIFFVLVGLLTRRLPEKATLPVKIFTLFWLVVGLWSFIFIINHGMLYVKWPKLNPRPWVAEGYQEAYSNVLKNKIIGTMVTGRQRGLSTARYTSAEEGKKRIE